MKIPFALVSRSMREPAVALLLPSRRAADLFDLLDQLSLDALPPVFATADGFLCKLPQPVETPIAGVIRLRKLAGNLYLPVDADIVPPLLPDEAEGLAKTR